MLRGKEQRWNVLGKWRKMELEFKKIIGIHF